ncbi:MAG: DUF4153 domain-containing protein [Flavobacteriia bacterium]|nr:DUF4153 domain-containing protein [Flavobacteriia bacterium]
MNQKINETLGRIKSAANKYPVTILMSLTMTAAAIFLIESDYENEVQNFIALKILLVSALGISLSFGLSMLSQRINKFGFLAYLCIPFVIGFYFLLPADEDDFTVKYFFLFAPSYVLSHLLVAFVPFLKSENSETDFWEYNKKLFVNFFLTVVFTGVLCGGVELAITAVDNLFNMDFDGNIYPDTFMFFLIFGSTLIFLLFTGDGLKKLEEKSDYPNVLKFFTQFVLIPLLIIYVVILYLYSIKILINWELPRGWVSYLVLVYSMVGILALLLVHPLRGEDAKSWVRIFGKMFYYTLIPLLVLLFVAIFTRLLEYGFTEARYYVVLLALWLTLVVGYFALKKNPGIKFIPISLFVFGIFSLLMPFANAFSVAKNSQKNNLMKVLTENKLLKDGKIDFSREVKSEVVDEISDKFIFLDERGQLDYLLTLVDDIPSKTKLSGYRSWNFRNKFSNIIYEKGSEYSDYQYYTIENLKTSYETEDYDYLIPFVGESGKKFNIGGDILKIDRESNQFILTLNDKFEKDLMPEIKKFVDENSDLINDKQVDDLSVLTDLGPYQIKVLIGDISVNTDGVNEPNYRVSDFVILASKKE